MSDAETLKERVLGRRGEKRRMELLLPSRVVRELGEIAKREHKSLNRVLLEMVQNDGRVAVAEEDYLDLRRAPTIARELAQAKPPERPPVAATWPRAASQVRKSGDAEVVALRR